MSVDVVINFQALPGCATELRALLSQGRDISRAADGCESFALYQRDDDEHKFMFLERWTSIDAHHENMGTTSSPAATLPGSFRSSSVPPTTESFDWSTDHDRF